MAEEEEGQEEADAGEDVDAGRVGRGVHRADARERTQRVETVDLVAVLQDLHGGNVEHEEEELGAHAVVRSACRPDEQRARERDAQVVVPDPPGVYGAAVEAEDVLAQRHRAVGVEEEKV